MSGIQTTPEDIELFRDIAGLIVDQSEQFRAAGKWLDDNFYDEKAFARHREKEFQAQEEDFRRAGGDVPVISKNKSKKEPTQLISPSLMERFLAASKQFREPNHDGELNYLNKEQSAQILLLTWLLTDIEADQMQLNLTAFENWQWNSPDKLAGTTKEYGREFTNKIAFASTDEENKYRQWVELVKKAWTHRPILKIATKNDAFTEVDLRLPRQLNPNVLSMKMAADAPSKPVESESKAVPDLKSPYMPVDWFKEEFGLTADALRGQARRGSLAKMKRGRWNQYSVPDAMAIWPHLVTYGPKADE